MRKQGAHTNEIPGALYKFMPSQYVEGFVKEGKLLFRNLTSFKQMEHAARGDVREGCHVDSPNNDVVLENLTTGRTIRGRFSARTSIVEEKVYALCLSRVFDSALFDAFHCDACVSIFDYGEFIRRCRRALARLVFIDPCGCLYGSVEYYSPDKAVARSIEEPRNIPFLKPADYRDQCEFRVVFARKGGFKLTKRFIVNQAWDTVPDHLKGTPRGRLLTVGSLRDIVEVRLKADAASWTRHEGPEDSPGAPAGQPYAP